ncbi:MAG: NYN domain-containing protein, partial [Deltaproteobacteria bacterium]
MELNMCVLMDFENIAAGAEKEGHGRFDTRAVMTRLKEKGRILIARSYGDWGRFAKYKQDMLEHAVQAVELTSYRGQEKNRADIALAVDAMELAFRREYIDTFVLLSGDSDFTPLVMRLRELNRRVIGIGTRRSSSRLLVESCDEFIFYESIKRGRKTPSKQPPASDAVESLGKDEAFALLVETIEGLQKDEPGPALAGRVKQSLLRKEPAFDETEYGYSGFARFLEAARDKGLVSLSRDERAGGYRVDLPSDDRAEPADDDEGEDLPLLTGEPGRLRGVLLRQGIDPLDALSRHVVVHEFVDHVNERARRKKRNTLIYTVGDVARRTRQTEPPVRTQHVRSVLQSIFEAGELIHADGNPIRKDSAPFTLQHDAEEILRELRSYYVANLLRQGERLNDSKALSMLLWGDEDHATPAEELVAWVQHELAEEDTADGPTDDGPDSTGEATDDMPATPVGSSAAAEASVDAADAPGTGDAGEDAPKRKRRRRRRKKTVAATDGDTPAAEDQAEG